MLNYNDPELVFIKSFRGNKKSFFQISSHSNVSIILKDVEHGTCFEFQLKEFKKHIQSGLLKARNIKEIPDAMMMNPASKVNPLKIKKQIIKKFGDELERKFKYVKAAIHSDEVPAYTAKWLNPWIKKIAAELNDNKPPSWRTLAQWISDYVRSGWKKESLLPRHNDKGRHKEIDSESEKIMKTVIREFSVSKKRVNCSAAHREYLLRIEAININKTEENKPLLKPISLRTMMRRFND